MSGLVLIWCWPFLALIVCRNVHITVQLSTKIFYPDGEILWSSIPLTNHDFDDTKHSFYADGIAITLSEDGTSYTVKSIVDPKIFIDLTVTQTAPGFKIGKDGRSHFGTDPLNPWGAIRHVFWPRNKVVGFIKANGVKIDFGGSALHVMALQGMKPHHAGMFSSFHSPARRAVGGEAYGYSGNL